MTTTFRVTCYSLTAPTRPVDEGDFETLDAAKTFVDGRIAKYPSTTVFTPWEDIHEQWHRETNGHANMHANFGFCISEE